jgi:hypothetical protein
MCECANGFFLHDRKLKEEKKKNRIKKKSKEKKKTQRKSFEKNVCSYACAFKKRQ